MIIGWIGTGVMGASMAGHLLRAGHAVVVHSRTRAKAEALLAAGAFWADTPRAAAERANVLCSMVGYPHELEDVLFGTDGALRTIPAGALYIDFTTSRPGLAERIASEAAERGVDALDAPVSGGDRGARDATLSIFVGGRREAFERALPILRTLGRTVVYHGAAGAGQHAKLVNQIMIAGNMIGVCEGLLYARRAGLDPESLLESVGGGAAASWSLTNLYPRILDGDMQPGFYVKHFIKDLEIALDEAACMGLDLPGLALARELYLRVRQCGGDHLGTQALILALEDINVHRLGR